MPDFRRLSANRHPSCIHSDYTVLGYSGSSLHPPQDSLIDSFTSLQLASDHRTMVLFNAKQKPQHTATRRPPLLRCPTTSSVRVLRAPETYLACPQARRPASPPLPPQLNHRTRFHHAGNSIPPKGPRALMSFSNSCRLGLASNLSRRLRNRSATQLGDTSSIWPLREPS
jgi:hypothetical protein